MNQLFTYKQTILLFLLINIGLLLSGCVSFTTYVVNPFSQVIDSIATIFDGNYGLAIIAITLAVRLILLPLIIKQTRASKVTQEKMKQLKPEMDAITAKYKTDQRPEAQLEMQKEMSAIYAKHGTNPFAMLSGCVPLLLQMPIYIGLYYAIRESSAIATHSFLWFELGQTDIILAIITIILYVLQAKISTLHLDNSQQQMKFILYVTPIMMCFVVFIMPSALVLYWAVGVLFLIAQTIFLKRLS